jgi:hypothetical protein
MSYEEEIAWGVQQMLDADLQFPQDVPVRNVVKTNADHIRSMTDNELAEFLCDATYKENEQGYPIMRTVNKVWWHKWLKQPYKEDT